MPGLGPEQLDDHIDGGAGVGEHPLDLVARRTNLETDAECVCTAWWQLLTVDKERLMRHRGDITSDQLKEVDAALVVSLGLSRDIANPS